MIYGQPSNLPRLICANFKFANHALNIAFFQYDDIFLINKIGLPIGSPFSGVIECSFLKFLELDQILIISVL